MPITSANHKSDSAVVAGFSFDLGEQKSFARSTTAESATAEIRTDARSDAVYELTRELKKEFFATTVERVRRFKLIGGCDSLWITG